MSSRSASVADLSALHPAAAFAASSSDDHVAANRGSGWAAGPGTLSVRMSMQPDQAPIGDAIAIELNGTATAAVAVASPRARKHSRDHPSRSPSRSPRLQSSPSPLPHGSLSAQSDAAMVMAVAAVAAALSQQSAAAAAAAAAANNNTHSHSNRSSMHHSRASSSASLRVGGRTNPSSTVVSPQHSPAHAMRNRDRGGAQVYRAVVSWALDPAFPLEELCAAAAAPFMRPWRWLLCALPILALYIAADVFSALSLPVPSFGGEDFDAFVTGGWVAHYAGMVCFLSALAGLFFKRHPYHPRFLLLFSGALLLFLVSSVLHTSRLSASDSIWSPSEWSSSLVAVQLSWLANALLYILFGVLAYRAPASALKDPHPDDKEKLDTLLEIRRAELLRLERLAEISRGEQMLREKRASREREDAQKREWYAARKAARKLQQEQDLAANGAGSDADLVVSDVAHHSDDCVHAHEHAPAAAASAASAFASVSAGVAGPVRVSRVDSSDSPTPAPVEPAQSPSGLSTFSLPLPSSYLRGGSAGGGTYDRDVSMGTGTGVSSVIHYTMPSATSSVLGYDGAVSGHQSIWHTMQPPSAAESRAATAPATPSPAQGPLQMLLGGAQRSQQMQMQLHASPDGDPLSAGWQTSQQQGHHRGSASNGGSADLHFYSPAPAPAPAHHHSHQQAHSSHPDLASLLLPLAPLMSSGGGALPGLPLHVVYDESPQACSTECLPLPPFPPHHPELALALGQVNVDDSPSEQGNEHDLAAQVLTPGRGGDATGAGGAAAAAVPPIVAPAWPSLSQPLSSNNNRRASWGRVARAED